MVWSTTTRRKLLMIGTRRLTDAGTWVPNTFHHVLGLFLPKAFRYGFLQLIKAETY